MGNTLFALVWVMNFAISIWNAYAVGKIWIDAKIAGGWYRFMCWIGAIMSACGFTWCYLSFLALTAHHFQWLSDEQVLAALNLGYLLLLPFILFAGYAITFDSWAQAFRRGGLLNYGVAAWNTYATVHNTYSAWQNLGGAFASLGNFFGGDRSEGDRDRDGGGIVIVILLVVFALLAGVLTTATIIRRVAASEPLPPPPPGDSDRSL